MLSMLCHFHGLLFARQYWMNRYATQRNAPYPPRNAYRERLSLSALAISHQPTRPTDRRVAAAPLCLVIHAYETSSEGELLSDIVISVSSVPTSRNQQWRVCRIKTKQRLNAPV
jgi:hypothetical protein